MLIDNVVLSSLTCVQLRERERERPLSKGVVDFFFVIFLYFSRKRLHINRINHITFLIVAIDPEN